MLSRYAISAATLGTLILAATPAVTHAAGPSDWLLRQLEQTDGYDFRSNSSADQSYQSTDASGSVPAAAAQAGDSIRQNKALGAARSPTGRSGAVDGSSRAGAY